MELFIISFFLIALSLVGMAAGVLMKRSSLKGSCGGLNNFQSSDTKCPVCGDSGECIDNKET